MSDGELPLVAADQLVYRYPGQPQPALNGVSLRLARGQSVGLLGPNGSGKSTLINLLIGLRTPQGGSVSRAGGRSTVIAWVPQEYAFYPELTCHENLSFFASMLDLPAAATAQRVQDALTSCMLHDFAGLRARHCSGGVRRRLNLGIALLPKPDVLLLDEPTVGVDPQSRAFLLEHVRELVRAGTAVLYATHYMEEVSTVCSRILVLDQGRVLANGDLATLLAGPEGGAPHANLEALFMHYTHRSLRD